MLELYRSFDLDELEPYVGKLGELGCARADPLGPGRRLPPARVRAAFRGEIPGSKLVYIEGTGHFLFEDEPERCASRRSTSCATRASRQRPLQPAGVLDGERLQSLLK